MEMKIPTLNETLRDNQLFGQFIESIDTFRMWESFFRCWYAEPPEDGDLELLQHHAGRSKWPSEPPREGCLIIGARGGKTRSTSFIVGYEAAFRKHNLSAGEKGHVIAVAPTKKQGRILKSYVSTYFNENYFLKPFLLRETAEELELNNNVIVSILSSDYRTLRGYSGIIGVIDELAYFNLEGSRPDIEVVRSLRSRLLSTKGRLLYISTPYSKRGHLFDTYRKHFGVDDSPILVWKATSLEANPSLSEELIAQAYEEDGIAAAADYGADFRSDIESYVSREIVEACISPGVYELPPHPNISGYRSFVDPAGGSGRDSMTLAVAHSELIDGQGVVVLDCLREIKPPFSPDAAVKIFAETLKHYGLRQTMLDRYAAMWPRERFEQHGINCQVCDKPKSDLYLEMLPVLNCGQVQLLDNERLIGQICSLERRTSRIGKDAVDHMPGQHDDLSNVLAGVVYALRGISLEPGKVEVKPSVTMNFDSPWFGYH